VSEALPPIDGVRRIPVRNASGEDIPACAAVRVTGYNPDDDVFTVGKPTEDSQTVGIAFNGPVKLLAASGATDGWATVELPAVALCYAGDGTPAADQTWGTSANQWYLRKNNSGFVCKGDAATGPDGSHYAQFVAGPPAGIGSPTSAGGIVSLIPSILTGTTTSMSFAVTAGSLWRVDAAFSGELGTNGFAVTLAVGASLSVTGSPSPVTVTQTLTGNVCGAGPVTYVTGSTACCAFVAATLATTVAVSAQAFALTGGWTNGRAGASVTRIRLR
jgi:hypothetical protein